MDPKDLDMSLYKKKDVIVSKKGFKFQLKTRKSSKSRGPSDYALKLEKMEPQHPP
jgi:hypothetical protein